MIQVVDHPKEEANALILAHCFGHDWAHNVGKIKSNLQHLASAHIPIVGGNNKGRFATYNHTTKKLIIWDGIFAFGHHAVVHSEVHSVALILIHEATHAVIGAVDHFLKKGFQPILNGAAHPPETMYSGCEYQSNFISGFHAKYSLSDILKDFRLIRDGSGASTMVKNADSYTLLAHLASEGYTPFLKGGKITNGIHHEKYALKSGQKRKRD